MRQKKGDVYAPYGLDAPHTPKTSDTKNGDYIEDICRQVVFHEHTIHEQQRMIGQDRFWIISYEQFCREPEVLVQRVSEQILGKPLLRENLQTALRPFEISNKIRGEDALFAKIERTLSALQKTSSDLHRHETP